MTAQIYRLYVELNNVKNKNTKITGRGNRLPRTRLISNASVSTRTESCDRSLRGCARSARGNTQAAESPYRHIANKTAILIKKNSSVEESQFLHIIL